MATRKLVQVWREVVQHHRQHVTEVITMTHTFAHRYVPHQGRREKARRARQIGQSA